MNHIHKCKTPNYKSFIRKVRENPHDLRLGEDFFDMTPKAQKQIENLDSIKILNFCFSKDMIKRMKNKRHTD